MIRLSVIIPTFNRRHVLERTLPLLFAQEFPADAYEVIIVVDGSTDGSREWLDTLRPACGFRVLDARRRGPGAARNAGIQAARGERILFLDDDLLCPPNLLALHASAHESAHEPDSSGSPGSEVQRIVHGPIYVAPGSRPSFIRLVTESFYDTYYHALDPAMQLRSPEPVGERLSVLSLLINSSIPREALLDCGGFDEQILAAEDFELGIRLYKLGCVFRFLPTAAVHEIYVKSTHDHLRGAARSLGAGDLRIGRKHPEFRVHSSLSVLAESSALKRLLLSALVQSPVSVVPLLAFPLRWEQWMIGVPALKKLGFRLLALSERLVRLRSAAQAAGSWSQLQREFSLRCPSLLYHHVGPLRPGTYSSLNVPAERFEQQIRWLSTRGYQGIRPSEWLAWVDESKPLPAKPVLITFDDAYADIAEHALPVLERYGFRAAVYLPTERVAATNTWDEAEGSGTLHLMTADQILHWSGRGIEFGAHSKTHADLPTLTPSACEREVAGSRLDLEALLGTAPASFAYPYGHYNDAVHAQVRSVFAMAFSTIEGMNFLRTDRHLLRRIYVGPTHSLVEFGINVARGKNLHLLDDLRIKLALRTRLRKTFGFSGPKPQSN